MDTSSKGSSQVSLSRSSRVERSKDECPICKGTGFVYPVLDSGETDFSRVQPCQCQKSYLQQEKLRYLERYSNLGALSRFTFDTLSPGGKGETASWGNFSQIYDFAMSFAMEPRGWVFLLGPVGCGKTHIACAIANYRLEKGYPVFYIGVSDLLDHLRSAFSPSSELNYDELFERVKKAPLLVLDDLNMENATPWAREKVEQLFQYRFNSSLPTVITSDVPAETQGERLYKYLCDEDFCRIFTIIAVAGAEMDRSPLQLEMIKKMTFDSFDCQRMNLSLEQRQNLRTAFQLAKDFAANPEGWLIFQGLNGCGKTHLAAAIANYQLAKGTSVFFIEVPDLLDHLRSTFGAESKVSYDKFFEKIKTAPLLVLDDFGQQSTTPWAQEKLYQLVNYRYNAMLPTIITMCASLEEIEVRCSSRMVDPRLSLVFNITAPDYRGDVNPIHKNR